MNFIVYFVMQLIVINLWMQNFDTNTHLQFMLAGMMQLPFAAGYHELQEKITAYQQKQNGNTLLVED